MRRAAVLIATVCAAGSAVAATYDRDALEKSKPPEVAKQPNLDDPFSDPFLEEGRVVYLQRCAPCHGARGAGDGIAADYLDPRPRDFTQGSYKLRSTQTGELPTDADLFRSISAGVPGTAMPAWGEGKFQLSERQRWQLVAVLKLFNEDFVDEEFDPYGKSDEGEPRIVAIPPAPEVTAERIERGKAIFLDEQKGACPRCHGKLGRGDGSDEKGFKDDAGNRVDPGNLTKAWKFKNGSTVADIFATFSTGLNGTPMPGYVTSLPNEDDRWDLAMYVYSLQETPAPSTDPLVALAIEGELPDDPAAEEWAAARPMSVWLAGQVVVGPRWQNGAVDLVEMRALYNDEEIALLFRWHDRFENRAAPEQPPEGELWQPKDSYIKVKAMHERAAEVPLPDQLAVHFPTGEPQPGQVQKPYLLMGDGGNPTNAWLWRADRGVVEARTAGTGKDYAPQPDEGQTARATARFADGQWTLIVRRPLRTEDGQDVQFTNKALIPFTLRVWDGSTGEWGLQSSMSSWHYIRLESETPTRAYLYALLAALIAVALELLAVRALRRAPLAKERGVKGGVLKPAGRKV